MTSLKSRELKGLPYIMVALIYAFITIKASFITLINKCIDNIVYLYKKEIIGLVISSNLAKVV